MKQQAERIGRAFREAGASWLADHATTMSAALAYYTTFSIAPLLIITIGVVGVVFGNDASRGEIFGTLQGFLGPEGAKGIQALVEGAAQKPDGGAIASVVGALTLLIGATGLFAQLQDSLNLIWKVQARPGHGAWALLRQRLISFSMILVIAFLLLVSLLVSAALAAMGKFFSERLPGGEALWQGGNFLVSFGVITFLFAAIYKILPDARVAWGDTWIGAAVTAALFALGKFAIGTYIGHSGTASAYGAAGSVLVVLLWVFYSSCILFFGAEFTRAYALQMGHRLEPKQGAVELGVPVGAV